MNRKRSKSEIPASAPIRIGISACLLGEKVRYDGGHKHDRYLTDTLGGYFEWVPVCPEVELGLGIPRETMRLEKIADEVHAVTTRSGRDLTDQLRNFARGRVEALAAEGLNGYILKGDSPSCGMLRVKVYGKSGTPSKSGRGLFAAALAERFPQLPIEEEGRLCDPRLRENWIERVFAYRRLQSLWNSRWTAGTLLDFHTSHKMALLAHSPKAYRELGQLVSAAKEMPRGDLRRKYQVGFLGALAILATRGRHTNTLRHMAGYLRNQLDEASRMELAGLIDDYRKGDVPLIIPLTLLKHYVRVFGIEVLAGQVYLNPHPKELALRSHV